MDTKAEKFSVGEKLQTELKKAIEKMPRRRLANLPTPLEEAPRLSKAFSFDTKVSKMDIEGRC